LAGARGAAIAADGALMIPASPGAALYAFAAELYPICRSITGDGVRKTLELIGRRIELKRHEIPSGAKVFDWEVPLEWNIDDAYVLDADGRKVVDFSAHNLHILNYSEPIHVRLALDELMPKLHSLPDSPDWIPYRTSYYKRQWGFCMRHRDLAALLPGEYRVRIDSRLTSGSLTYAECVLPGRIKDEVLFFTHTCHPSLANDNTSGMAIATALAAWIGEQPRRYSYRFVFAPGTIGSLCWLSRNEQRLGRVRHGLVLGLLGDPASLTYKFSRRGNCEIDQVVPYVMRGSNSAGSTIAFEPYGYDERQLCSPGFNLPVGRLTRSVNGGYPQYHSSADDLDLITPEQLDSSLEACKRVVETLESNRRYINLSPKGEPRLGRRGLYGTVGGRSPADRERAMLWVLNQSDGAASTLDIAERSNMSYADIRLAADDLQAAGLLMTDEHPRPERAPKPDRKAAPATRRAAAARSGAPRRAPARHKRKGEKK
jgi:aminopeptidase-like protein